MAETTIEWTRGPNGERGYTFNPWWGCNEVSPGCDNCYARRWAHRVHPKLNLWGKDSRRLTFDPKHWNAPLGWNKKAERAGTRFRVFSASMADVFDNIKGVDDERAELWTLIHKTPSLDWLLLTKRVGNVARMVPEPWMRGHWPKNAWLGASVVNQEEADRDIPKLLALPAPVRFLSIEPMLGPVDLRQPLDHPQRTWLQVLDWVICGGESGPGARPMHPDWARSLRDQCAAAGVPFLFKQWGEWGPSITGYPVKDSYRWPICSDQREALAYRVGKAAAGRLLDGVTHDGFPA